MKIAVVGTGYVGLVSGACFSEVGIDVTCIDIDTKKIEDLRQGIIPIYEPGLKEIVEKNAQAGRLHFSTSLTDCLPGIEIIFLAVGTPPLDDGSADLSYIVEVAKTIGKHISN
jgi:UDPglucose 6-dehydrogenase